MQTFNEKEAGFRLMERDVEILDKLIECEAFTRWHVEYWRFSPKSRSKVLTRLRKLYQVGIIKRIEQKAYYSKGREPYVYLPTKETVQAIALNKRILVDEVPWTRRKIQPDSIHLPHILDIAWCNVAFFKASIECGFTIKTWWNTIQIKRHMLIDAKGLEPDAYALVQDSNPNIEPYNVYIEMERTRDYWEDVAKKMERYLEFFEGKKGRACYILLTREKMLKYKEVCERIGGRNRFWFGVLSELLSSNCLRDPIWMKSGAKEQFSFPIEVKYAPPSLVIPRPSPFPIDR